MSIGKSPGSRSPDFRAVFESTARPLLLIEADPPRFTMVAANKAHARAFGTTPEALVGRGVLEVFGDGLTAEAQAFVDAIRRSLEQVLASGRSHQMGVARYAVTNAAGDSLERFWSAANSPVRDRTGRVTHIVSAVQDVTGEVLERQSEAARALLMREIDHRARNSLTVVHSLIRLAHADSVDELREVLEGRVGALARAHSSLAARRWEGALLAEVVESALAPFSAPGRCTTSGPLVLLPAEVVQPLSMLIHELATNAFKHGALSGDLGRISVDWRTSPDGELRLTWSEHNSGRIAAPRERGFGFQMMSRLARQMSGEVSRQWKDDGLLAEVNLRLPAPVAATVD